MQIAKCIAQNKGEEINLRTNKELIQYITDNIKFLSSKAEERKKSINDIFEFLHHLGENIKEIQQGVNQILERTAVVRPISLKRFAEVLIDEYWRLCRANRMEAVRLDVLAKSVSARLIINESVFRAYLDDLQWVSAGKITIGESRYTEHIIIKAKTPEELIWK